MSKVITKFHRHYFLSPYLTQRGARCLSVLPQKSGHSPPNPKSRSEPKTWLTQRVESSPLAKRVFLKFTNLLGYGSPKQVAGRRTFVIYEQIAARKPEQDKDFWQLVCHLPPTFQSWFTVTDLHIWMLAVRFRALPEPHGRYYEQSLIDHFFFDIEDRIRAVLQPRPETVKPYTFHTNFYVNPNVTAPDTRGKTKKRAPEGVVTKQMKIFKEQWAGMGLAFDLSLMKGDTEMAAAVWRNLLGARGAQGISYPSSSSTATFRRSVNLVGGEVVNVAKLNLEKEETMDDGSGVHDFPPEQADRYLSYPTIMLDVVSYVRRELTRLQSISDEDILAGNSNLLKFGKVRPKGG